MSQTYKKYKVTCSNIEWDVTPEDCGDDYDPAVVAALPKQASITLEAPDKECAKDWGLNEISDNHGFCIQGCTVTVARC